MSWTQLLDAAETPRADLRAALQRPRAAQQALLGAILRANETSKVGRRHAFAQLRSVEDFRAAVPISSYENIEGDVVRAAAGVQGVLTTAPVVAFEETGGSSRGAKLIPYTDASLAGFRNAVLPWLAALAARRPALTKGRAYVAISPAARAPRVTAGGLPVGLPSDAAYLGADLAPAFARLLAVSPDVGALTSLDAWREATLRQLIACEDLSFVSVWSPTFFLGLIEAIPALEDRLAPQLDKPARDRLARATKRGALDTQLLWPWLDTVSCWTDGASRPFAERLAAALPHMHIDAKGLLATEAAVTTNLGDGAVPALTSTFIEFVAADGRALLADELDAGESYRIVITTWGGLYRYDLGDIVTCVGFSGAAPRLRFDGRGMACSDLVGEKLTEAFVARALSQIAAPAALAPAQDGPPRYELWLDSAAPLPADALAKIEGALRANPQYAYARDLGQLGALTQIAQPGFSAWLIDAECAAGRRLGDIKPPLLLSAAQRATLAATR